MSLSINIILPIVPIDNRDIVDFKGYISAKEQQCTVIYVTEILENDECIEQYQNNLMYVHIKNYFGKIKSKVYSCSNYLILEKQENSIGIGKLVINGKIIETGNIIIMLYDYNVLKSCETVENARTADIYLKLQTLLQDRQPYQEDNINNPIFKCQHWLSSSMFAQHILNYISLISWLIITIKRDKKISIKPGNLILAILTDVAVGYFVLRMLTQEKKELSAILMGILENLVNLLYSLLKWLMGSPAGLKLNNAFNKMLGKYFSYHIQLWWLFLDVSGEKLETILHIYHYLGYLGFTFQAAIISDMICIATFHSYCIYVYAARLFYMQVSGLIALLRLFVGRKYNPLRGGIDSCEYTNQELFVGTVAFTILLLLLPTTTMYYIVFTLFRLLSLVVQYMLAKLIYLVHTLPLYVVTLWLVKSSKVAGNILIEIEGREEGTPLVLKLFSKSLQDLISNFRPPVEVPKQFEWTNVLSNVLIGKHVI